MPYVMSTFPSSTMLVIMTMIEHSCWSAINQKS